MTWMRERLGRWAGGAALAAGLLLSAPAAAVACGAESDCVVAGGAYRILTPPERAEPALGAIVYLHGYQGSPEDTMRFGALRDMARELGVALIAPRGVEGRWNLPGVFGAGRDDVAFIRAVADDAVVRFGLDPARIVVSGFSLGASMAWYVACAEGRRFAAYAPVAGSFWEPYVKTCRTPAPELHHVHGLADATVPMEGRALSVATQGDTYRSFALLRGLSGCHEPLGPAVVEGRLTCRRASCAGARQELCLHAGGHSVEPAWIARAWRLSAGLPADG
jgi:polyhydroxybutyrate depolymerase